jgi:hypothetical protein
MRIIPNQGVCDPHVHIYNGKAYMFTSHDREPGMPIYHMDDWRVFSSDDLLNWKLEYTLRPEDTFLGKCDECYATDSAERNGKYYLYFSHQQKCTGVAVSENGPAGPYRDALGKPLLPQGLVDTACYDPAVFIDDDEAKTPYILFGYTVMGKKYYIARLNEDLISLAEDPRPIEIINGWQNDAVWLTKRNGIYYLNSHEGEYAVSDNPYGPYTYRGKFCRDAHVDHGTFFTYHNQTYLAYGVPENWGEEPADPFYRTTKMVYAHYKENGDIVTDEFITQAGVGHYDTSWDIIKGEWYFAASDGTVKTENSTGFDIRGIRDGSYLYYPNVNGMVQNALLWLHAVNSSGQACSVEIRENSPFGHILGCCSVGRHTGTQNEPAEIPCRLENTFGTHNLCFVFRGEGEDLLHFDGFHFEQIKP